MPVSFGIVTTCWNKMLTCLWSHLWRWQCQWNHTAWGLALRLPWWLRCKSVCLQCGRPGFDPWVGKILSWRRKWQSTPVLLPGKSHGQRSLVGYSPWGCKQSDTTERLHFSVVGRGCVPSLSLDLRPNYGGGNEENGDLLQKVCLNWLKIEPAISRESFIIITITIIIIILSLSWSIFLCARHKVKHFTLNSSFNTYKDPIR